MNYNNNLSSMFSVSLTITPRWMRVISVMTDKELLVFNWVCPTESAAWLSLRMVMDWPSSYWGSPLIPSPSFLSSPHPHPLTPANPFILPPSILWVIGVIHRHSIDTMAGVHSTSSLLSQREHNPPQEVWFRTPVTHTHARAHTHTRTHTNTHTNTHTLPHPQLQGFDIQPQPHSWTWVKREREADRERERERERQRETVRQTDRKGKI